MRLWYKQEAATWTESLPVGNGRMGAMVYGKKLEEIISLNEETLWSGYPRDKSVQDPFKHLEHAKAMVREKRFHQADEYIEQHFLGDYTDSYLPLGDLKLFFHGIEEDQENQITEYVRELDLDTATTRVSFLYKNVMYQREVFVSAEDQVLMIKLSTSLQGALSLDVTMDCQLNHTITSDKNHIELLGIAPSYAAPSYFPCENPIVYEEEPAKKGMQFGAHVVVTAEGGDLTSVQRGITIHNANQVVIQVCMRTSYNGYDKHPFLEGKDFQEQLVNDAIKASSKSYESIKLAHLLEYQKLFQRVELNFGERIDDMPTDERLIAFQMNQDDPYLYALLFHYGRYLLISSSRNCVLPANLQGIWNNELRAPFSCNYTTNINVQMNYWPAESSHLEELHKPLFDLIQMLMVTGAKVAKTYYHAEGVVTHHNVDLWGLATPVGRDLNGMSGCGNWNGGFGWLSRHLMEHYDYSLDLGFLEQVAYPAIKQAALFYIHTLERNEQGYFWPLATTSPENTFIYEGNKCHIVKCSTMSIGIIREVFSNVIKCCKRLSIDEQFSNEVKAYLEQLYPYQIGDHGQLLEWEEAYEEYEPHHRHISHLYPLYPGDEIHPNKTPELANACKVTLCDRTDVGTGWSLGWKINTWARLQDGDHALKLLKNQLKLSKETEICLNEGEGAGTYLNLFDAHPPFQIDGNFAAVSGICEMLLQSYDTTIVLLPALPHELPKGFVKGLRAKNGVEVQITFDQGELIEAFIQSTSDQIRTVTFMYQQHTVTKTIQGKQGFILTKASFLSYSL